jgi:aryl sulfotransferase
MSVEPSSREYRTWVIDSRRWDDYRPRRDDIVISTYPKCGTTWMQRIVGLLVFKSLEPMPIMDISAWIDRRTVPIETVLAAIDAQTHRRFLKSHIPRDGMPFFDEVKYIHVARDGRDACMSYHNHCNGLADAIMLRFDAIGLEDPAVGRPYPRPPADPAAFFHRWITQSAIPGDADGMPMMSFFNFVRTWWEVRHRPNVLLVHYNDLLRDLPGEMRRIASFLEISVDEPLLSRLVEAASFEAMRKDGTTILASVGAMFQGGSERFFHKGTNGRWKGVVSDEDLAAYDRKAATLLPPECAAWLASGRLALSERAMEML